MAYSSVIYPQGFGPGAAPAPGGGGGGGQAFTGGPVPNPILEALGTPARPAYAFGGAPGLGVYAVSATTLGLATQGALAMSLGPMGAAGFAGAVVLQKTLSVAQAASFSSADVAGALSVAGATALSGLVTLQAGARLINGSGDPRDQVSAAPGSLFLSSDGGAGLTLFIKESDLAASGWVPVAPASGEAALVFPLKAPTGATASSPSYAFTTGASGLFGPSDDVVALATAGMTRLLFDAMGTATLSAELLAMGAALFSSRVTFQGDIFLQAGSRLVNGTGAPEGATSAPAGSLYLDTTGAAFIKESGTGSAGWAKLLTMAPGQPAGSEPSPVAYPLLAPNGLANAPSYAFSASPQTGMFSPGTNAVALTTAGVQRFGISADGVSTFSGPVIASSDVTVLGKAALQRAVLSAADDQAPSLSFSPNEQTGLYYDVVYNGIGVTVAGTQIGYFGAQGYVAFAQGQMGAVSFLATTNGTASAPAFDVNGFGGMYYDYDANALQLAFGGASALSISGAGIQVAGRVLATGTAASPAYAFSAPADFGPGTGLFYDTTRSTLGVSLSGAQVGYFTAAGYVSTTAMGGTSFADLVATSAQSTHLTITSQGSLTSIPTISFVGTFSAAGNVNTMAALNFNSLNVQNGTISPVYSLTLGAQNATAPILLAFNSIFRGYNVFTYNDDTRLLNLTGALSVGSGQTPAAPTGGLRVQGSSVFVGSVTFQGGVTGATFTPSFPLLAPATTLNSYSFNGANTTGMGSSAAGVVDFQTAGATALRLTNGRVQAPQGIGIGGAVPTSGNTYLAINTTGGLDFGVPSAQLNFPGGGAAAWTVTKDNTAFAAAFGYNAFTGEGVPEGTLIQARLSRPLMFAVGTGYSNIAAIITNTAGAYAMGVGGQGMPLSTISSFGNMAVGAGVAGSTAAPSNGLLVQGNAIFQGNLTVNGTLTAASGGGVTYPLLAPNGTQAAPSYAFSAGTGYGVFYDSTNAALGLSAGGTGTVSVRQGLVGVNTPVPLYGLHVSGGGGVSPQCAIDTHLDTNTSAQALIWSVDAQPAYTTYRGTSQVLFNVGKNNSNNFVIQDAPTGTLAYAYIRASAYSYIGSINGLSIGQSLTPPPANNLLFVQGSATATGNVNAARVSAGTCVATTNNVLALAGLQTNAGGIDPGCPTVQVIAQNGTAGSFTVTDQNTVLTSSFGYNNYTLDGVPICTLLQARNNRPFLISVGAGYTDTAASAYNVSGNYFWTFGARDRAQSTVGVFGNLAVGQGVAQTTAAPSNGLLVQGNAIFQGSLTVTGNVTSGGMGPLAVLGNNGNFTATTAQSGAVINATQSATLTLPTANTAAIGVNFTLVASASITLTVQTASASDILYWGGSTLGAPTNKAQGTAYTHANTAIGACMKVVCVSVNKWIITSLVGTAWT